MNNPTNLGPLRRILLVEDEEAIAKPLGRLLRMSGYDVVWAADGVAAIEWLESDGEADLILVDIMMPRLNGWQFRDRQKSLLGPQNSIPAIFLSADSQSARRAAELGEYFISKPIDLDYLRGLILKLIQNATASSRTAKSENLRGVE